LNSWRAQRTGNRVNLWRFGTTLDPKGKSLLGVLACSSSYLRRKRGGLRELSLRRARAGPTAAVV